MIMMRECLFQLKWFFCLIIYVLFNVSYAEMDSHIWNLLGEETKKQCRDVQSLTMPKEDMPSTQELDDLTDCNTDDYYGFDHSVNYKRAKICAYKFKDNHILAMLYANGYGVKKNIDLALHYTCLIDGSLAEITSRINGLQQIKNEKSKKVFELCEYETSYHTTTVCSEIRSQIISKKARIGMQKTFKRFNKEEKALFNQLSSQGDEYIELRTENEMNRAGRMAGIFQGDERVDLIIKNTAIIASMSNCRIHEYTEKDYRIVDDALNSIYKEILLGEDGDLSFTVAGVKKTQRAWLRYKILIEKLGALRCPHINPFTWGTIVTKQRLKQLKAIRLEQKEIETGARERNFS